MYADASTEPRTAAESYSVATGASSLKFEGHSVGSADSIGAAGMNPHTTGLALMRLQGEWDRAAKPKPPTRRDIEALAASFPLVEAKPYAGLVEIQGGDGKCSYRKPLELADEQAQHWYLHELGLLFGHLKTLPPVRDELERWVGPPHAARLVADILGWWLEPRCHTCRGCGKRVVEGTGGRSSGKVCWACKFSTNPGERPLPHSGVGRRLLAYIRSCYNTAAKDQQQGVQQRRSDGQEFERSITRHHAKVAKLRRADEVDKAEEGQDKGKVAEAFKDSMGKGKLRG